MLPTNVMSFMKKMVTAEPGDGGTAADATDGGTAFGKLKQTLSSSLLTAQDKVTKISPRPTVTEAEPPPPVEEKPPVTEPIKPINRCGACRVCLKAFKPEDFHKTCAECTQRVCEDCASYSKKMEDEDEEDWKCSVCRRKLQSRPAVAQDSTESLLDIPVQELQRRHSEARLGTSGGLSPSPGGLGGLAPPRSPELRRHSDVSPASLKELEKLKGGNQKGSSDQDWNRGNRGARSVANSRSNSPPREPVAPRSRRASRVTRQHSYGEDVKPSAKKESEDSGLSLPTPMPRRASAYDVFSVPGANSIASPALGRKASFRAIVPDPASPPSPEIGPSSLATPEEDRRVRRRGSQLPEISGLRPLVTPRPTPALEDLEATPRRQASIDAEAIRIVIHDVDSIPGPVAQKRLVLRRDPADKAHRTRGFGMRVVGGKTGIDGRLFAYIVWTVPGGPAEKGGLQQGDRVLEWGGISLIDRSFEEVCAIMDRTGDIVELLVEHASDLRMCDILDDPIPPPNTMARKLSDVGSGLYVDADMDKGPSSPTRRKLPKTPEQLLKERQVSGRVQIQVWYHDERRELVVAVLAADDLAPRDESLGYGSQPEAYARLCLMPLTDDQHCVQTEIAPASQNPIWNANLSFPGVPGDELMERTLDVTLWDLIPQTEPTFLGECSVDLQKAFLDDRAVWCRLEDPRQMRGKSPQNSPRGSIAGLGRRGDFISQRSASDDVDSIGECASLLHPDHAWGSRRGSSQSETLEVEVYQLGKDFSKSLPGSRRSSFQSGQEPSEPEAVAPPPSYSRERRRSSCTRMLRDPEEILRSLKAVKGELGRTMSLSGDKKHRRSTSGPSGRETRENSIVPEVLETTKESPPSSPERTSPPRLGPGQVKPRGFRLSSTKPVELKLGLQMTKGQLEVEVLCARHIPSRETPPDTYVKCYLRDGDRWLQKKKTRVVKHSCEPQFKQTLKYQACDVLGRSLVIMLWERQGGFEHNLGLGGAEVALDLLTLTSITTESITAVCQFYSSLAGCQKGPLCPFRHVRGDRTIVCKHWLRGLCKKGDQCEFLHEYDMTKMPECYFYSRFNACHNKECPFLHIDPESKIKDCPWYDRGFCRHGPHCRHRHVRRVLCTNYVAGFCLDGPNCKYMHPRFELPVPPDQNVKDQKKPPVIICHFCGEHGHKALHCNKMNPENREMVHKENTYKFTNNHPTSEGGENGSPGMYHRILPKKLEDVTCYKCGAKGHYANRCPKGHLAFLSQVKGSVDNENKKDGDGA